MANILERRSPQKQVEMMDLATHTVTAVVDVLPREQEFISSSSLPLPQHINLGAMLRPIKEEEKEEQEQEWLSVLQQHEIRPKPMKQPRERTPRKIISHTVDVLPREQDFARFCSRLPQYISLDAMLRLIKKEEKEEEWLPLQQSKTLEPMKQQRKRGSTSKKIISQSLSDSFEQPPQAQDDQDDTSNGKKKKTNSRKKMNRGCLDFVFPETPRRERSRREGITRRRVTCASPPASSSSNFGKDFATAAHNSVPSPPPTSGLEMPGPIPDFWDLIIPDIDFLKDFFEDLPQD